MIFGYFSRWDSYNGTMDNSPYWPIGSIDMMAGLSIKLGFEIGLGVSEVMHMLKDGETGLSVNWIRNWIGS